MPFTKTSFLTLALAAWIGATAPSARAAGVAQWVMGYYVGYLHARLAPKDIGWNGLTHIVMSPMTANADGTVNTDFDWDSVDGPALARQIASRAHAAGKRAILMLGGAGNGTAIKAAVAGHRAAFIANLIAAMKSLGYDGLDLDWEDDIDWPLFEGFVTALRTAAPGAILTMPVGPLNLNYQTVDPHLAAMAPKLDRINVMSYYPATAFAGSGWLSWFTSPLKGEKPATPISINTSLQAYVTAGIARNKLGMGISFYAICYTGGITKPNQSTETGVSITGGDNDFMLSQLYGPNSDYNELYRHWYAGALEPYLSLPKPDSFGGRYISYEDEQSITAKGLFSRQHGYGGIIIWTLNEGYVASHPNPNFLMDALQSGFIDPAATHSVAVSVIQTGRSVKPSAILHLAALVTGAADRTVTWSLTPAACGSIDGSGVFTAPAAATTCTATATSHADPRKSAKTTIRISAQTP